MAWNLGDVLDGVAEVVDADAPAAIHGERIVAWPEFSARSNNLGRAFLAAGAVSGERVAFYMRNRPEYSECFAACVKSRLVHVNINYRYRHDELYYIFDDSDAVIVVYDAEFRDNIAALRPRLGKVKAFIEVCGGGAPADFATDYEDLAGDGDGAPLAISRSPDDMLYIYTGGTTGMPKGVMWRAGDFYQGILDVTGRLNPVPADQGELLAGIAELGRGGINIPAPPLMHGTGFALMVATLMGGGAVLTLTSKSFDADELWATAARHRAARMNVVGDAFARPMVRALDAAPGAYDLSALLSISSSGVMWSMEVKRDLLRHIPQIALVDSFGATEALGFGGSVTTKDGVARTAQFTAGADAIVIDDEGNEIAPGSGRAGWLAATGPLPLGYHKDPEKSARVFKLIGGVRYAVVGDRALVEADGAFTLLGRGSTAINTGGEKVFPEEIEEILKTHASVEDALVVGIPDETWGQAVTAVIETSNGQSVDEAALRSHVRERLAGFKVPKRVLAAAAPLRAANGKADYETARNHALKVVAASENA